MFNLKCQMWGRVPGCMGCQKRKFLVYMVTWLLWDLGPVSCAFCVSGVNRGIDSSSEAFLASTFRDSVGSPMVAKSPSPNCRKGFLLDIWSAKGMQLSLGGCHPLPDWDGWEWCLGWDRQGKLQVSGYTPCRALLGLNGSQWERPAFSIFVPTSFSQGTHAVFPFIVGSLCGKIPFARPQNQSVEPWRHLPPPSVPD